MKKQPTDMSTAKTKIDLTLVRAEKQLDGTCQVVTCGYAENGKFGYFICKEKQRTDKKGEVIFEYSDFSEFYPKDSTNAYQTALSKFKQLTSAS